jgi:putative sterol carrier protein
LAKFMSDEYFKELEAALTSDPKWAASTKSVKTSIMLNVTDAGQSYLLTVDSGNTTLLKSPPGSQPEFSFDGTYDAWSKVARGESDMQSAVLKGQLKFKGSITKILLYRDRFIRIADLMKAVPKEF